MTKGLITPPTDGQKKQFRRLVEDVELQFKLDKDAMQRLLANGGKFVEGYIRLIENCSVANEQFEFQESFDITIPKSYDHSTQLTTFALYAKNNHFYNYQEGLTDENLTKWADKLIPGKTYRVKIFRIRGWKVSSDECLAFLVSQNAILAGAQGLSLVCQFNGKKFPFRKNMVSYGKNSKKNGEVYQGVPYMVRKSEGDWRFEHATYGIADWNKKSCILCFCDLNA